MIAAAPIEDATTLYNAELKAAMPQTSWVSGCSGWYLGKDGLPDGAATSKSAITGQRS